MSFHLELLCHLDGSPSPPILGLSGVQMEYLLGDDRLGDAWQSSTSPPILGNTIFLLGVGHGHPSAGSSCASIEMVLGPGDTVLWNSRVAFRGLQCCPGCGSTGMGAPSLSIAGMSLEIEKHCTAPI